MVMEEPSMNDELAVPFLPNISVSCAFDPLLPWLQPPDHLLAS